MAKWEASESRKVAATGTALELNFESQCTGVMVQADDSCFIDFDKVADIGSFPVIADLQGFYIPVIFTRMSVITSGGSANLYVLALRQKAR